MKCRCVVSGLLMFLCVAAAEPGAVAAVSQTSSGVQMEDEMDDIYENIPELAILLHDASRMAEDAPVLRKAWQQVRKIVDAEEVELFPGALLAWQAAAVENGDPRCRVSPVSNVLLGWERYYWSMVNLDRPDSEAIERVSSMMQEIALGRPILSCCVRLSALYEELALCREWLSVCERLKEAYAASSKGSKYRESFALEWYEQEIAAAKNRVVHVERRISSLEAAMKVVARLEPSSPMWHGSLAAYVKRADVLVKRGEDRLQSAVIRKGDGGVEQKMMENQRRILLAQARRTRESMAAVEGELKRHLEFLATIKDSDAMKKDRMSALLAERDTLLLRMDVLQAVQDYAALFPVLEAELAVDTWR